eukprot:1190902-Prorocentrum_minimum.AAC.1
MAALPCSFRVLGFKGAPKRQPRFVVEEAVALFVQRVWPPPHAEGHHAAEGAAPPHCHVQGVVLRRCVHQRLQWTQSTPASPVRSQSGCNQVAIRSKSGHNQVQSTPVAAARVNKGQPRFAGVSTKKVSHSRPKRASRSRKVRTSGTQAANARSAKLALRSVSILKHTVSECECERAPPVPTLAPFLGRESSPI